MNRESHWALCLALALACGGCAGNGEGLDENGRPLGGGGQAPLAANLQSIQDHVFTPICTQCHAGAAAPLGFRLDQDSAYAMLVNAPSSEVSSLQRVTPGDPDASYLIQKLEGAAAVGAQMPLGQPPLPQETIDVIRQWIANGAQATASSVTPSVMPMQLHAITPTSGQIMDPQHAEILLQADGELAASTLTQKSVQVTGGSGDALPTHIEVRSLDPTVLAITLDNGAWQPGLYRLVIEGGGDAPAKDRDGIPVGGFSMAFTVGETR
jgi:hypothetical protein